MRGNQVMTRGDKNKPTVLAHSAVNANNTREKDRVISMPLWGGPNHLLRSTQRDRSMLKNMAWNECYSRHRKLHSHDLVNDIYV